MSSLDTRDPLLKATDRAHHQRQIDLAEQAGRIGRRALVEISELPLGRDHEGHVIAVKAINEIDKILKPL